MKRITKKNKIRIPGTWDDIGMEVYWHPKTDYIFYIQPLTIRKSNDLEVVGEFGKLSVPLEIKMDKKGNAILGKITPFDLAILKLKLEHHGFKNYKLIEKTSNSGSPFLESDSKIIFKSKDERAMFQLYFSNFIVE